jgi:MFS transporter, DHA2 family, multidrug resistance protein
MSDGLPQPQRGLALLTICIAVAMSIIDSAIVNVALPTISTDLAVTPARSIWVVNAYQLAITVSLLPLASLGDILSYRTVYRAGIVLFTLASIACGLSDSLLTLTLARIAQGFGAAGIMSVNIALIRAVYPKSLLGVGVGNVAMVVAICSAAGPSVGAAILAVAPWRWLFFINGPLGLIASVLAFRVLPLTPRLDHKLDALSVALNAVTFSLLIVGVQGLGAADVTPALFELGGAAVSAVLLTWRQFGLPLPVLPIDLLRRPVFALSMVSSVSSFSAQSLLQIGMPFYLMHGLVFPVARAGLLMTAFPAAIALMAPLSGRLADRFPPGLLGSAGLLAFSAGLLSSALMPHSPTDFDIAWRLALCGIGFGFFQSPNNRVLIGSAPPERSGGAAGLQSTGRLVGQSLGAAITAVIYARGFAEPMGIAMAIGATVTFAGAFASGLRKVPKV